MQKEQILRILSIISGLFTVIFLCVVPFSLSIILKLVNSPRYIHFFTKNLSWGELYYYAGIGRIIITLTVCLGIFCLIIFGITLFMNKSQNLVSD